MRYLVFAYHKYDEVAGQGIAAACGAFDDKEAAIAAMKDKLQSLRSRHGPGLYLFDTNTLETVVALHLVRAEPSRIVEVMKIPQYLQRELPRNAISSEGW